MWHVPATHGNPSRFKVVMGEQGEEALFPSASLFIPVERNHDAHRREWSVYDRAFQDASVAVGVAEIKARLGPKVKKITVVRPRERWDAAMPGLARFVPVPYTNVDLPSADVVLCARRRAYGEEKNWRHWGDLAARLNSHGVSTIYAGAPDSSFDLPGASVCHLPRFLDATIAAMRAARLVIATDNGLAHLAMLVGRPLLLISEEMGRTAPGYARIKLGRFKDANHKGADLRVVNHAWQSADPVFASALDALRS
jgi:hypothetical protein